MMESAGEGENRYRSVAWEKGAAAAYSEDLLESDSNSDRNTRTVPTRSVLDCPSPYLTSALLNKT